jgi:hypothetical protein
MADADQSFDAGRMAREQESRVAASAEVGLSAARPFVQFQASLLRLVAHNFELAARNFEKSFEAFGVTLDQHRSETHQ